jgi:hypothetical protein
MGAFAEDILGRIHPVNPYNGFDFRSHKKDLQGGGGTEILTQVFQALKPRLIVEVGSWKGASAVFWAQLMRQHGIDGAVVCIDTWLGGLDHLTRPKGPDWQLKPYYKNGYPTLYYQFLANIMHEGLQDLIVPVATTSAIGARWLATQNLQPDVVYIDASHDEDDVYQDLVGYWKQLKIGGIACGDDFSPAWYGVIAAVNRFSREQDVQLQFGGISWVLQKSLPAEQQLVLNLVEQSLTAMRNEVRAKVAA